MATTIPLITDKEETYLLTLSDMFSSVPLRDVLACLRKNNGSMEDAAIELLSVSRQPQNFIGQPKPSAPVIPTAPEPNLGGSTFGRMQQELSKVYEDSMSLMEEKLKEQAVEIRRLNALLSEREAKINELHADLNRRTQELDNYRKLLDIRQISNELAANIKHKVDSVLDQVQSKNIDTVTFRHLANLVRQEMAHMLLKDIQESPQPTSQTPLQSTLQSTSQTSSSTPYWRSPSTLPQPANSQNIHEYQNTPAPTQATYQYYPVPSAPNFDPSKIPANIGATGNQ